MGERPADLRSGAESTIDAPLRALVFDFDGVILESNECKTDAFRDVFSRFPEHTETMMAFHRQWQWKSRYFKIDHLVENLLGRRGDTVLREELASEFSRRALEHLAEVPFVPGAKELLEEFAPRVPLYVASVTPQADLDATVTVRGLRGFFRDVYGCPPWTKTGAVADVIRREGCAPSAVALVGDAPGDLRSAEENGAEFVGRQSAIAFDPKPARMYPDLFAIADALRPRLQ